jgi:uncharacterized protein YegL
MKILRKIIVVLVVFVMLVIPTTQIAYGGDGGYTEGTPDKLTLNAMFQYQESEFNPNTAWEGAFDRASTLLYNSTDGQVQIGTVNFYNNCPQAYNKADILIHSGSGGGASHMGGLGTSGRNIDLYNDTHTQDVAAARGQFGIVHELGHFVFGLYDEYKYSDGTETSCISETSTVASIMDGGTTIQPNNQRTEWSLPADSAACTNTAQYQLRGMTAWPWIKKFAQDNYSATLTVPTTYTVALPPGHQALTFNYFDCKVRAVVSLDRSGSMEGNAIDAAKSGAKLFVDLNRASDELGVSAYSSDVYEIFSVAEMTPTNKTTAKAEIDGLYASGNTNIGGGLQLSLDMIAGQGNAVSNEIVVLLSDGLHNTGTDPNTVLPSLAARGVKVYTIGLGNSVDASQMSTIAEQTGGSYYHTASISGLLAHYATIFADMRSDGMIVKLKEEIQAGGTKSHTAFIDNYTQAAGEATFVLSWPISDLDLTLMRPDGTTVSASDADVIFYNKDTQSMIYRVSNPTSGDWTAQIHSNSPASTSKELYNLQVSSIATSNVMVQAATDKSIYDSKELVLIQASVRAPMSGGSEALRVAGAEVTADVMLGSRKITTLTLYDDGLPIHGDEKPDDGVYSALYYPGLGAGSYAFNIMVNNQTGTTAPPDEETPGWTPSPIDPFARWSQVTVVVNEAPFNYLHLPFIVR